MKTIYQKESLKNSILGKQTFHIDSKYRKMHFCFLKEIDNNILLWNALTKQLHILTSNEKEILCNQIAYNEEMNELIEKWCLVPVDFDESKLCDQLCSTVNLFNNDEYLSSYVIFTTTLCNARCFYCFENGCSPLTMDDKTAESVANYMIKNSNGRDVKIAWFGGEPLCNTRAIDIICKILQKNAKKYESSIITNGYLMNKKNITKSVTLWNLKQAQITLDGTEKVYNNTKNYIYMKDSNPFQTVLENISSMLLAGIQVKIRLNISDENEQDLYSLIDLLSKKFGNSASLNVYCANLYDIDGKDTSAILKKKLKRFYKIDRYLSEKGLLKRNIAKWASGIRGCMAQNPHSIVITPEAKIGKCERFSEGDLLIGDLYSKEKNKKAMEYWDYSLRLPECNTCELYPHCIGITHCPNTIHSCIEAYRPLRFYNLEQDMRAELNKYLRSNS